MLDSRPRRSRNESGPVDWNTRRIPPRLVWLVASQKVKTLESIVDRIANRSVADLVSWFEVQAVDIHSRLVAV